jgi:hypothetical protein
LAGVGDTLYVGGTFNNYGIGLAVVDTGEDPPARAPGVLQAGDIGGINALAVNENSIYIAGDLRTVTDDDGSSACWNYCERTRPIPPL